MTKKPITVRKVALGAACTTLFAGGAWLSVDSIRMPTVLASAENVVLTPTEVTPRHGDAVTETWKISQVRDAIVDVNTSCLLTNGTTVTVPTRRVTVPVGTHPVTILPAARKPANVPVERCDTTRNVVGEDDALYHGGNADTRMLRLAGGGVLIALGVLPLNFIPSGGAKGSGREPDAPVPVKPVNRVRRRTDMALLDRWAAAKAELADLTEQWLSYEKDYALFLSAPAMRDYSQPTTLAAAEALGDADTAAQNAPEPFWWYEDAQDAVVALEKAVRRFATELAAAISYAEGAALSKLTPRERTVLERAQRACAIAMGSGATRGEIDNALALLHASVRELGLAVPVPARQALEHHTHLMLEPPRPAPPAHEWFGARLLRKVAR